MYKLRLAVVFCTALTLPLFASADFTHTFYKWYSGSD